MIWPMKKNARIILLSFKWKRNAFMFLLLLFSLEAENSQQSHKYSTHLKSQKLDIVGRQTEGTGLENAKSLGHHIIYL